MKLAKEILALAMNPEEGARTISHWDDGELVGAASYRMAEEGLKICNIASLRKGIGTALFKELVNVANANGMSIWLKADPDAAGFYKKMGMTAGETLPDGRIIFRTPR